MCHGCDGPYESTADAKHPTTKLCALRPADSVTPRIDASPRAPPKAERDVVSTVGTAVEEEFTNGAVPNTYLGERD